MIKDDFKHSGTSINSESDNSCQYEYKINPQNTFDSFVEGKCNHISFQVSMAVAESPGELWNPFFLYGESGLGKTHLLHAIGNYILDNDPSKTVVYVPCKQFIEDAVDSLRDACGSEKFKTRYMSADVLLIDDFDQMIGKEATLDLFTDMLDVFRELNKQVIITADRNFREFEGAPERLLNRIAYGIITDLSGLDNETSCQIIRMLGEQKGIILNDEIIYKISDQFGLNVPSLQGVMNKIEFLSKGNEEITLEDLMGVLNMDDMQNYTLVIKRKQL